MDIPKFEKKPVDYDNLLTHSTKATGFYESEVDKIAKDIAQRADNAMAMEFTRRITDILKENGIIVNCEKCREEKINDPFSYEFGIYFTGLDTTDHDKEFQDEICQLEEKCEMYLEENKRIKEELNDYILKTPISIAKSLIDNEWFTTSELRQIAEHLLVYCNYNHGGD